MYLEVEKRRQFTIEFTAQLRKKEVCIEVFVEICQKKSSRVVLRKRCSENMQHIYRRTCVISIKIPICDFNKVYRCVISIKLLWNFVEIALWHGCSPVTFLNIFRTSFPKNNSGGLLLNLRT